MTAAAIREKLHRYIDSTDDRHVEDLLNYVESLEAHDISDADMKELHERADKVLKGKAVVYTVAETHSFIRNNKKR
ncbi:hypothetical protein GCM10023093_08250 [Nemorincola caseinilytica]|uniref:Uncharacterized protein n=1 Tax=Nemorincola caseinilytica TaxID=2054315 RepID=A0ABP8N9H9_9BACT